MGVVLEAPCRLLVYTHRGPSGRQDSLLLGPLISSRRVNNSGKIRAFCVICFISEQVSSMSATVGSSPLRQRPNSIAKCKDGGMVQDLPDNPRITQHVPTVRPKQISMYYLSQQGLLHQDCNLEAAALEFCLCMCLPGSKGEMLNTFLPDGSLFSPEAHLRRGRDTKESTP